MWQSCTCGKNSLDFILIKILHTEYDFQDTDFTMLNLNNVICKLNMKLSSLKCLNKKKKKNEIIKCMADVLPVTTLIICFTSMEFF